MTKKYTISLLLILSIFTANAHYLWLETSPIGKSGISHEVKVFFGEYTYGLIEKTGTDAFNAVDAFQVWVLSPEGSKMQLQFTKKDQYYISNFTPSTNGLYTVILDNNEIDVIDYTKYDFGIFKTHYHSVAKIAVGEATGTTIAANDEGITILDLTGNVLKPGDETRLQVLFKGKPLAKAELKVFLPDQWSKDLETDEDGNVSFLLPWDSKYIVEVTKKEEVPGVYKGESFEFIWHCVTYAINP